jgi:hypothetical protein
MARDDIMIDVKDAGDKKVKEPSSAEVAKDAGIVRFWATQPFYKIAVAPGKNLAFKKHVLELASNDPYVKTVRELRSHNIKEVLDVPFKGEEEQARFNKFLQALVFDAGSGKVKARGKTALLGLFDNRNDISSIEDAGLLVIKALKSKSFKDGI